MKYIDNYARKFGSAPHYWLIYLEGRPYLFTQDQIDIARIRPDDNPEDLPPRTFWQWLSELWA